MTAWSQPHEPSTELADRIEAVYVRAACAVAERDKLEEALVALRERRELAETRVAASHGGPMAHLAIRLGLTSDQLEFLWAAVALAVDPGVAMHAEALAGTIVRRGLSVALYARMTSLDPEAARQLSTWLARDNPLVSEGLLIPDDTATAVMRSYAPPARLLAYLGTDPAPDPGLRVLELDHHAELVFDDAQLTAIDELRRILANVQVLAIVEGPVASGRTTAIAAAAGQPVVVFDASRSTGDELRAGLLALRREVMLGAAIPVIARVDRIKDEDRAVLSAFVNRMTGTLVLTSSMPNFDLGSDRPVVRVRWNVAASQVRQQLWEHLAGAELAGNLEDVSSRFRVGPGAMARAIKSARISTASRLDVTGVVAGLRHNISEELGGLAQRIEVTQTWDDLVLAPDTLDQIQTLISRVRDAHQVLEHWGYRGKMARGTGVPALFSGPPGTGKTMVAGLIARELGLDLYQVDLSQIVSKWVGETEKQLARVFDAAEQGHGLLLFDEADALFGQRTQDVKGAVDRYANLEVNYLLQRVESFGGITILTTNLDQSIDRALKRRLAAHIVFELPDEDERTFLWQRLITTSSAPLARDIDHAALAREFPKMSGANIRNAALAAAFLAAGDRAPTITHGTLVRAARGEYRSMGFVLSERRP